MFFILLMRVKYRVCASLAFSGIVRPSVKIRSASASNSGNKDTLADHYSTCLSQYLSHQCQHHVCNLLHQSVQVGGTKDMAYQKVKFWFL